MTEVTKRQETSNSCSECSRLREALERIDAHLEVRPDSELGHLHVISNSHSLGFWLALKAAREVLRSKPSGNETEVFGWVVEGAWSPVSNPEYWNGSSLWSTDPYKALRFVGRRDAEQAAGLMCAGMNIRICEHGWEETHAPKAVDQRAIDANALADAHRMYEAEHGHPFSESEGE